MQTATLPERRVQRSDNHSTALRFQLESTLERGRLSALALTDQAGLLLAWAGNDAVCQELGAVAPVVAHGWPAEWRQMELKQDDVAVRTIECFGQYVYLASLGGGVARDALLAHSARGIHRILTAN
ncbi:MAG: hypothetical protein OEZ06_09090 [Myxococcales bacterium]|nr:hypothetical protein [Myxococcales bacterium]